MVCKLLPVERPLTPATLLPIKPELEPAPKIVKNIKTGELPGQNPFVI